MTGLIDLSGWASLLVQSVSNSLPASDIEGATELLLHGEFGIAVELICTQLREHEIAVDSDVAELACTLCRQMALDDDLWRSLGKV